MTEIEQLEEEIKVLQKKLDLLKEIENRKEQMPMELEKEGVISKVQYNGLTYWRIKYDDLFLPVWWKQTKRHKAQMSMVSDSKTKQILDDLWLNDVQSND
jgi:hypothetical protein